MELMKTPPLLITAILVIIIIAGAVTYLAVSVNGGPESAS